jgi:hypothetical protein
VPEETTVEPPASPEDPSDEQQPETFDADYVAKLRKEAARYRTEAKANADAAKRLAEIEEANKSEIEKANDAKTEAEQRAARAESEALRWKVAAKHGISDEDAELFLTGTDEETLTKQAKRLADRVADRKKTGNVVPKEGTTPREPPEDEMRAFARDLFQRAAD